MTLVILGLLLGLVGIVWMVVVDIVRADRGNPRFVYMGEAFPMRWHISGPWSFALRPEVYWDPNGFHTGAEQFVRAVTTTAGYKFPYKWTNMIGRLEYRYDESTGSGGGLFKGNEIAPGVIVLTPAHSTC